MQATWVSLVALPVFAINAIPAARLGPISIVDIAGLALWASGFILEVAADRQKSRWAEEKKKKKHSEDFIHTDLWARSRHPNYAGETMLWTGIAAIAAGGGLAGSPVFGRAGAAMALVSPLVTYVLVRMVSGVPLSESKWGLCRLEVFGRGILTRRQIRQALRRKRGLRRVEAQHAHLLADREGNVRAFYAR